MGEAVTIIGFGEAGATFATAGGWGAEVRVYDRLTDEPDSRAAKEADYARAGVTGAASLPEAILGSSLILSLVTADQALHVARDSAPPIGPGALFCDMNSVAPRTKRLAAAAIETGGGDYVDVAVLAPVHPAGLNVPLLFSGPRAEAAAERLRALGFTDVRGVGKRIGQASAVKMIRSVVVKGIEALTAECMLAAEAAGVRDEVLASLDASERTRPWCDRADYNLDRMIVHGLRRAGEMEEVVRTLDELGVTPAMTRGTVRRQREIGSLGLAPPDGLEAKLAALLQQKKDEAA